MKNRVVGYIIVGFAVLMGFVIWLFNNALTQIVNDSCSHGPTCPMWGSISFHTNLSLGITIAVALLGLYFIIFGNKEDPSEKSSHETHHAHKLNKEDYKETIAKLTDDEKHIFEKILDSQGTIFQSELVNEKFGHTKVKVTRILDRLEGQGLIERRRRGMTNVVILRH